MEQQLSGYAASKANDGNRKGGDPNFWADATQGSFPDSIEVAFNGTKSIGEIDVFTLQDNLSNPVEPTLAQTFSSYGITAFDVQYWDGTAWTTIPNGSETGNNKVWRQFTFAPVTTSKIRVVVNAVPDNNYSRIVEVEAWTAGSPTASGTNINWLVTDQLGTPRMIFDQTGSLANVKRHDYLPFGEELQALQGIRPTTLGYTGDAIRQKFTQKERDNETGLDYSMNRYYSSPQGRFTSADPIPMTSQRPSDPQRLNLYAYVRANPLNNIDPNGLDLYATGSEAQKYVADLEKATKLKLKLDSKSGKITIVGQDKKLSQEAERIKTIIGDTKNTVRIEAIRDAAGTRPVVGGQFEGGGRQTLDYADIDKFGRQRGGTTPGSAVIHETTEAYEGITNPQSLAATSGFQQFKPAHIAAIAYENSYRRGQELGERIEGNQITMTQGNQTLIIVDYTTHKERVVVENNQIKSVQVIKKQ